MAKTEYFQSEYAAQFYSTDIPIEPLDILKYQIIVPPEIENANPHRKNEFIAGRFCAFKAAEKIKLKLNHIPVGEQRAPVWPPQIIGSISHTKKMAIAVVASNPTNQLKMGIDIESIIHNEKIETIENSVINAREKQLIKSLVNDQWNLNRLYTLVFSAKESLYKALNPSIKNYIEFQEAELVDINWHESKLNLCLKMKKSEFQHFNQKYEVQFSLIQDNVVTYLEYH